MSADTFVLGGAAGFSGDRVEGGPELAAALAASGSPGVVFYETLAERTLALAHLAKRHDPAKGYEPRLSDYLRPVLKVCLDSGLPIVGNFGAANPRAAAERILALAGELGIKKVKVGVVEGDDLLERLSPEEVMGLAKDAAPDLTAHLLVSANVYLGAQPIAQALEDGAQVVVTGRVADPALALGPLASFFGWDWANWDNLAAGTVVGHLLECAAQVTGGYFADPGFKDLPDPAFIGFPLAEVDKSGRAVITKPAGSGGLVSRATVTEQILYEIHDPSAYLTPDVILDITGVELEEIGPDRVLVRGARGKPRPPTLKATLGFDDGWLGEGEISYAGPNCLARARLAIDIVKKRMARFHPGLKIRGDVIGAVSLFNDDQGQALAGFTGEPAEARARLALRSLNRAEAEALTREVLSLYTCGPAAGGGVRTAVTPRLATASALVPRDLVRPRVSYLEVGRD